MGTLLSEGLVERDPIPSTRAPSAADLETVAKSTEAVLEVTNSATLTAAVVNTLTGSKDAATARAEMRKRAQKKVSQVKKKCERNEVAFKTIKGALLARRNLRLQHAFDMLRRHVLARSITVRTNTTP